MVSFSTSAREKFDFALILHVLLMSASNFFLRKAQYTKTASITMLRITAGMCTICDSFLFLV
jgi:hypothetical protein